MISKIIKIRNVGLFENACPNGAVDLSQATAIYAENGRGKSTLAAIFRACANSESERVEARSTIDKSDKPEIEILLDGNKNNRYDGSVWSGPAPSVFLFDAEFVETNVYSGFAVRSEQRQEFLEFALGEASVLAKQKADDLTEKIAQQQSIIRETGNILEAVSDGLPADEYVGFEPIEESVAEGKARSLRNQIAAASNAEQIKKRREPEPLHPLKLELAPVFGVLSRQLQDIASDAEQAVTGHIALHSHEQGLEGWISQGQKYLTTGLCPFCGVSLDGNELIAKYQSYFNEAYRNLKDQIANLSGDIDDVVPATFVDRASSNADTNEARITVWNDDIALSPPKFDREVLTAAIGNARQALIDSAERKEMNPLEPACDQATELVITNQIELANAVLVKYNADIKSIVDRMSEYKSQVADHDVSSLRNELRDIELSARLTTPQIADARKAFLAAQKEKRRLENEKDAARESGDQTIKTNLQDYETKINAILKELGADFVISKLSQDYRGGRGAPRAGYVIEVRSKLVSLNTSPDFGSRHNFATTLSEADKRTLALAVFIARLDSEADLASKMVVLDDPVSSMDRNRRHQTVNLVAELAGRCQQLVVLSHDPHFLRMLNDLIGQSNQSPVKTLQIRRVQNGYSTFANCDLDELCASAYYRHFHMLEDFVHGTTSADPRDVAKAIRPLLEGFLHRRYPGHITRNQMLGRIISDQIKPATKGPFAHLQKSIAALEAINVYARQFQHDENPESESAIVADAELLHFATKTLDFIYGAP